MSQSKRQSRAAGNLENDIREIIVEGNAERLIERAKQIGKSLKNAGLSMAQIRGIFGTVRRIEMRWTEGASQETQEQAMRQLLLLQPKLEYQARRQKQVEGLRDVLIPAIQQIQGDRKRFSRFVEFFEAILAYHVAAGGKTN
ncbi:MAG: type III-A CRISPR-associated protein Csm2 [Chloroflexi bacterium]|nr:MAG: type III-A CRISPR-associated protein Csm2 [Chloroflexota bacterium]RLC91544.1 MAG: type III-A CRISPR-associated protein Csm2 [Chloroflexota bacterium]